MSASHSKFLPIDFARYRLVRRCFVFARQGGGNRGLRRISHCLLLVLLLVAFAPARADSDLDPLWDVPGGYTVTPIGSADAFANAATFDSQGRVIVAGYAYPVAGGDPQFAVVRYLGADDLPGTGLEDTAFNSTGIATVAVGIDGVYGYAVQVAANDSIVVAGDCTTPTMPQNHAFCLARLTSSGTLDTSFGTAGKIITRIGPDDAFAKAMTTDSSGNLLVAGYSSSTSTDFPLFTVARYSASGVLDTGFGVGGFATVADSGGGEARASAIALDADGNILVAGTIDNASYPNGVAGVVRLLPGGTTDSTFNGGAIALAVFGDPGSASALAIDRANRPIVAGTVFGSGAQTMALARFSTSGASDPGFGNGGKVDTVLNGCSDAAAAAVRVDASGRLFVAGTCKTTQNVLVLAHYNADGTLDGSYAPNGYETELFGSYAGAAALLLDGLERPLVVGSDLRLANNFEAFVINRHDYIFSHGFE